ncbi:hypothetical protein KIPB_009289 [Kipferlia bialata]|uniref:Uncharacterized protein n=1 Tax=Kipferlia bialata TaxID=797122 RepID=A0A9K3GM65_9EUKA|nr:hypothetical protein KIPB_009289 [Kipferlia bialata]|eukprot:g9289.t1
MASVGRSEVDEGTQRYSEISQELVDLGYLDDAATAFLEGEVCVGVASYSTGEGALFTLSPEETLVLSAAVERHTLMFESIPRNSTERRVLAQRLVVMGVITQRECNILLAAIDVFGGIETTDNPWDAVLGVRGIWVDIMHILHEGRKRIASRVALG